MEKEYIESGVYGLVVGDALGVPFEFSSFEELEKNPVRDMVGYGTWNQPKGTWSDDSSLVLATMGGIIRGNGEINLDTIMKEFVKWVAYGEYSQNKGIEPFDYGNTTIAGITNYLQGVSPENSGLSGEFDNGNGGLMRILPLAFTDCDYPVIESVCGLTHAHPRSKIASVLYVEICRQIMGGGKDTFCDYVAEASDLIQEYYKDVPDLIYFQRIFDSDYSDGISGSAHVSDTLESAIASIKYGEDFKSSLLGAVNLGGDTDTICAVCGGMAGLYYGLSDIPEDWINSIYKREIIDDLIDDFSRVI